MTRRTPLWVRGQPTTDFLSDPRRPCIGRDEYFIEESLEALEVCQSLCVRCPFFQDCVRWTLANFNRQPYFIYAGMTEITRRRIHEGKETFYDWRQEWRKAHLTERIAASKLRAGYRAGQRKREEAKAQMPPCPFCDQRENVCRNGRSITIEATRQRYHCCTCNRNFLGEEL